MRILLAVLAFAGVVVSGLALQVHYSTGTEPCSINERWDCGIVNHSSYAVILHVPVAAIGIAGYLAMALLALTRKRLLLVSASLVGLVFALYLTHIERDILAGLVSLLRHLAGNHRRAHALELNLVSRAGNSPPAQQEIRLIPAHPGRLRAPIPH